MLPQQMINIDKWQHSQRGKAAPVGQVLVIEPQSPGLEVYFTRLGFRHIKDRYGQIQSISESKTLQNLEGANGPSRSSFSRCWQCWSADVILQLADWPLGHWLDLLEFAPDVCRLKHDLNILEAISWTGQNKFVFPTGRDSMRDRILIGSPGNLSLQPGGGSVSLDPF